MGCACACPDTRLSVSQVGRGPCAFPRPCSQAQRGWGGLWGCSVTDAPSEPPPVPVPVGWGLALEPMGWGLAHTSAHGQGLAWLWSPWAGGWPGSLQVSGANGGQLCRVEASGSVHPGLHLFTQDRDGPCSLGKGRDVSQPRAFPAAPLPLLLSPSGHLLPAPAAAFWGALGLTQGFALRCCPAFSSLLPGCHGDTLGYPCPMSVHLWELSSRPGSSSSGKRLLPTPFLGLAPSGSFVFPLSFLSSCAGPFCGDY